MDVSILRMRIFNVIDALKSDYLTQGPKNKKNLRRLLPLMSAVNML